MKSTPIVLLTALAVNVFCFGAGGQAEPSDSLPIRIGGANDQGLAIISEPVIRSADEFQSINAAGPSQNASSIESLFAFAAWFETPMKGTAKGMKNLVVPTGLENAIANQTRPSEETIVGPTVQFHLSTDPNNPNFEEELFTGNLETLQNSRYNASKPVVFLIHAYFEAGNDCNIILVDNSRTTVFLTHILSMSIGLIESINQCSAFVEWLLEYDLINLDRTHIVGYSPSPLKSALSSRMEASF